MPLFRYVHTLLLIAVATNLNQVGDAKKPQPSDGDDISDALQQWRVFFDVEQSGGADSPTTEAFLETSHDGATWARLMGATKLTADGAVHEVKDAPTLGPYVRAITLLGGGTKPNHKVTVKLASTSPFKLRAE
jgi:hypothetical protein